jgi:hypothetical protein
MNWKLDISKLRDDRAPSISDKIIQAAEGLNDIPGIDDETAKKLVSAGFVSVDVFDGVSVEDLMNSGFSSDEACFVLEKIKQFRLSQS